jgi:hypothetical protein
MLTNLAPKFARLTNSMRPASILRAAALAAACTTLAAHAQPFNNVVGTAADETANGICATRDGGWITVGAVTVEGTANTHTDILAVKYNFDGAVQWAMRYGRERNDVGYSVRETPDEGYIIAAESTSLGAAFNLVALKIDNTGNFLWANAYTTSGSADELIHRREAGVAVRLVGEDSYVLTSRRRMSPVRQDGVIVRVQRDGTPVFQRQYFDPAQSERSCITFSDIAVDREEQLVVSGSMLERNDAGNINIDPLLLRTARDGSPILASNFQFFVGNTELGFGDGLDISREDSHIYFDGRTDLGTPAAQNIHLFRVDPAFNVQWMQVHRRLGTSYRTARVDHNNNFTIGGWFGDFPNASASMLLSVDLAGNSIFGMRYGLLPIAAAFMEAPNNLLPGYTLAGTVNLASPPGFGGADIELIHGDNNGRVGCLDVPFDPRPFRVPVENPTWEPGTINIDVARIELAFNRLDLRFDTLCPENPCPDCAADYNQDGGVDGTDVQAFFLDWSAGLPCADVNQDGGIDGQDVGFFLAVWQAGGC